MFKIIHLPSCLFAALFLFCGFTEKKLWEEISALNVTDSQSEKLFKQITMHLEKGNSEDLVNLMDTTHFDLVLESKKINLTSRMQNKPVLKEEMKAFFKRYKPKKFKKLHSAANLNKIYMLGELKTSRFKAFNVNVVLVKNDSGYHFRELQIID